MISTFTVSFLCVSLLHLQSNVYILSYLFVKSNKLKKLVREGIDIISL